MIEKNNNNNKNYNKLTGNPLLMFFYSNYRTEQK